MTRKLAPAAGTIPIVLLIAVDVTESLVASGPGRDVGNAVATSVRSWGIWLLLAPAIAAWDSALERWPRSARVGGHGIAFVLVSVVHLVTHAQGRLRADADVSGVVMLEIGMAAVLYALVVAAQALVQRAANAREQELAAARREAADARIAQLADAARLTQLYAQLQAALPAGASQSHAPRSARARDSRVAVASRRLGDHSADSATGDCVGPGTRRNVA